MDGELAAQGEALQGEVAVAATGAVGMVKKSIETTRLRGIVAALGVRCEPRREAARAPKDFASYIAKTTGRR